MNNSVFMTKRQSLKNLSEVMAVKIYMYGYCFQNNNNKVYTFLIPLNYMTFHDHFKLCLFPVFHDLQYSLQIQKFFLITARASDWL